MFLFFCSQTQYVLIYDTDDGSLAHPQAVDASLSPEGCALNRTHIRLFNGGFDDSRMKMGYWSIGAAHKEEFSTRFPLGHKVTGWDDAQEAIEKELSSLGISNFRFQLQEKDEILQDVKHDGEASFVEIQ